MSYEDAVAALYQSAHEAFVTERKRLSAELKAGADKAGAARLAKLARPSVSAWAVNQLWWQARGAFAQLFAAAERLRKGDLAAADARRDAMAALRARAITLLATSGHATTEATLRRVMATLAALAAAGSFEPDPPGALAADRDAPGFEGLAFVAAAEPAAVVRERAPESLPEAPPVAEKSSEGAQAKRSTEVERAEAKRSTEVGRAEAKQSVERAAKRSAESERLEADRATEAQRAAERAEAKRIEESERSEAERAAEAQREAERAEAERQKSAQERMEAERRRFEAERRRAEEERARRGAERQRLETDLRAAKSNADACGRELERLRAELVRAEAMSQRARALVVELEARLVALDQRPLGLPLRSS